MPTTGGDSDLELVQAVRDGKISEEIIDQRVNEILDVILLVTESVKKYEGKPFDIDAHHRMAMKAAGASRCSPICGARGPWLLNVTFRCMGTMWWARTSTRSMWTTTPSPTT